MATYTIELITKGESRVIQADDDKTIFESAEAAGVDLPISCRSGICTTCAARVLSGEVHQPDAMGVGAEPAAQGFTLLCAAYPRSDLKIETHQEDALYELQFGQFQK